MPKEKMMLKIQLSRWIAGGQGSCPSSTLTIENGKIMLNGSSATNRYYFDEKEELKDLNELHLGRFLDEISSHKKRMKLIGLDNINKLINLTSKKIDIDIYVEINYWCVTELVIPFVEIFIKDFKLITEELLNISNTYAKIHIGDIGIKKTYYKKQINKTFYI